MGAREFRAGQRPRPRSRLIRLPFRFRVVQASSFTHHHSTSPLRPLRIALDPAVFPRHSLAGRSRYSVLARSHLLPALLLAHTGASVNTVSVVERWCASLGARGAVRASNHLVEYSARRLPLCHSLLPTPFGARKDLGHLKLKNSKILNVGRGREMGRSCHFAGEWEKGMGIKFLSMFCVRFCCVLGSRCTSDTRDTSVLHFALVSATLTVSLKLHLAGVVVLLLTMVMSLGWVRPLVLESSACRAVPLLQHIQFGSEPLVVSGRSDPPCARPRLVQQFFCFCIVDPDIVLPSPLRIQPAIARQSLCPGCSDLSVSFGTFITHFHVPCNHAFLILFLHHERADGTLDMFKLDTLSSLIVKAGSSTRALVAALLTFQAWHSFQGGHTPPVGTSSSPLISHTHSRSHSRSRWSSFSTLR